MDTGDLLENKKKSFFSVGGGGGGIGRGKREGVTYMYCELASKPKGRSNFPSVLHGVNKG